MATTSMLKARGLETFSNYLSASPEGSLFKADNVNIDRNGIIEPRRGIKVVTDLPSASKQLLNYKNRILAHFDRSIGWLTNTDPATLNIFTNKSDVTMTNGNDVITLVYHGFELNNEIQFTIINPSSGVISTGVTYYIVNIVNDNQFKISTTPSGAPIVFDNDISATIEYNYIFEEVVPNLRIKGIEMNSSYYVTTKDGIKKIASLSTNSVGDAGGINALDIDLSLDIGPGASTSGFFGPLSNDPLDKDVEVAYSVVWGTKDVNNVLILGRPSSRAVITNTTGEYRNVRLEFIVPEKITEDYFFQIYRTQTALIDGSGAEFKLVYEAPFKVNADVSDDGYDYDPISNTIMVVDQQPDDLRNSGVPLYTNEFSGEGILQANDRPPVAQDIAIYKNCAFYSNTRTAHKLELTFLGFDGVETFGITNIIYDNITGATTLTTDAPHGISVGDRFALAGINTPLEGNYEALSGTSGSTINLTLEPGFSIFPDDGGAMVSKSGLKIENSDSSIVRYYFMMGRPETWELTVVDKATTDDGSYFHITTADDKLPYTFYIDKSGSAIPPVFTDRIVIKVDVTDAGIVTAEEMAEAIKTVIDSTFEFTVVQTVDVLRISTINSGKVTDPFAGSVSISPDFGGSFDPLEHIDGLGQDSEKGFFRLSYLLSPASRIDDSARSLMFVVNSDKLSPVEGYYLSSGSGSLPGAFYFQSKRIELSPFKVSATTSDFARMFNPELANGLLGENNTEGNAIYFSKIQQPEAVPIVNKINIGPRDKAILRIIGLRDSLFILKEEGVYRLTGENPTNFQVALFDNSADIIAPDSAAVLNNQIYVLTTQGIVSVSETGVGVISRPIENLINQVTSPLYPNYSFVSFGFGYEADRSYFIFIGDSPDDTYATRCYRYNTFTNSWTSWVKNARCGIVEDSTNLLFVGAGDINAVERERKTLTSRDFADRQYNRFISSVQFNNIYIDSAQNVAIGDVLTQTQYLSVPDYNRLINKLKMDPFIKNNAAIINLQLISNNNTSLVSKMFDLVNALNIADPSETYSYNGDSGFQSIQTQYNIIINTLNNSSGIFFADYDESNGTIYFDLLVTGVNKNLNTVAIANNPPFILGPVTHYKAIRSEIIWSPISLGDPSLSKHIRTGTVLIETTSLAGATVGYATDLSGNFETIDISLDGDGGFGDSIFNNVAWGGEGIAYPIITYIPRQKQRCRFIKAQFLHSNAFYKYSILGISYTFEMMSERAWR